MDLAVKEAGVRKAQADAMKAEIEVQRAQMEAQMAMQAPAPQLPAAAPQEDPMQAIQIRLMETRAMKEMEHEFKMRDRKLERDTGQAVEMGMGEDAAEPVAPMGPTPVELLAQAMMQQAQALEAGLAELGAGMQALASAQLAPTEIIRDQTGKPVGARKVVN